MSTRSRSPESREHSPDLDGTGDKRASKKRKVLSCYACRNRKMKCDRVYPVCGRCQKTGRADQCTYDPRLLEDHTGGANADGNTSKSVAGAEDAPHDISATAFNTSDSLAWKIRLQERRLAQLERRLAKEDETDFPNDDFNESSEEPKISEDMMFRGEGFKTSFFGSTSTYSLITQFRELQIFTREALMADTSVKRISTDFKTFRNRRKTFVKEQSKLVKGSDEEIFAALPARATADTAVTLYFQRFEDSYRVLHEPTFRKQYDAFWTSKENSSASLAALILFIVAITKCLSAEREPSFIGDSSAEREQAGALIDAGDVWLRRQSRKHLTIEFFQLQCLSLLAKRVNCIKVKQDWVNSGDALRLAIAAGLHRDPTLLGPGRTTAYVQEMRKRLWATLAELELQVSVDRGLQSTLCGLHVDTPPPTNLPDEAFSPVSEKLPQANPSGVFTRTSFLALSRKSLPLRIHLTQLLNNPAAHLQYSDVLHYDNKINVAIASLPSWKEPRSSMGSAMLDAQLRQFLLILHRPYALLAAKNQRFSFSLTSCVRAADAILSSHDELAAKGLISMCHLRNDVVHTGMTLAQVVYHNSSFPTPHDETTSISFLSTVRTTELPNGERPTKITMPPVPPGPPLRIPYLPQNDFMARTMCTTAIDLIHRARALFEQKVMRLGTGYMEYWLLWAAIGIMPSTVSNAAPSPHNINQEADEIRVRARKAVDHITGLCYRVLALQKDPGNDFASSLRSFCGETPDMHSAPSTSRMPSASIDTPLPTGEPPMQPFIPGTEGLARALDDGAKFDFGNQGPWDGLQDMQMDLSGWNFPDFWAFDIGGEFQ